MGHVIEHVVVNNRDDIENKAIEFAFYNCDRRESIGCTYHGNLTIHDEMQPFASYAEADAFLEENCQRRYDDHAVPFYAPVEQQTNKKIQDLERRIKETIDKHDTLNRERWVEKRTSAFIGCPNCNSKLNRSFLRYDECPVCRADLRPPSTLERLDGYNAKIKELRMRLLDEQAKADKRARQVIKWLVKLEVHG